LSIDYKNLPVGTEVEVTIKGKITSGRGYAQPAWATRVEDALGHYHDFQFAAIDRTDGFTVKITEPEYEYGQAYMDAEGEIFIRGGESWIDRDGDRWADNASYIRRPMTKLEAPATAKLQTPTQTITDILYCFDVPFYLLGYQEV
jgi:hypothetical protein